MDYRRKYMKYKAKYVQFKHNNTYVGGGKDDGGGGAGKTSNQDALIEELRKKLQEKNPQLYNKSDASKINEIAAGIVARNEGSSALTNSDEYYSVFETAVRDYSGDRSYLERFTNQYVTEAQQREADESARQRAQTLSARQGAVKEEADRMRARLAEIERRNEAAQREERERPKREKQAEITRLNNRIREVEDQRNGLLQSIGTSLGPKYRGCLEAHSRKDPQLCAENGCVWDNTTRTCDNSTAGKWTPSNKPYVDAREQINQLDTTLGDLRLQLQRIAPF